MMRSDCSASGSHWSADVTTWSGVTHRASASNPCSAPVSRSTTGWYQGTTSPSAIPLANRSWVSRTVSKCCDIWGSYRAHERSDRFASYIATSTHRISSSADSPGVATAEPMLTVACTSRPSR